MATPNLAQCWQNIQIAYSPQLFDALIQTFSTPSPATEHIIKQIAGTLLLPNMFDVRQSLTELRQNIQVLVALQTADRTSTGASVRSFLTGWATYSIFAEIFEELGVPKNLAGVGIPFLLGVAAREVVLYSYDKAIEDQRKKIAECRKKALGALEAFVQFFGSSDTYTTLSRKISQCTGVDERQAAVYKQAQQEIQTCYEFSSLFLLEHRKPSTFGGPTKPVP